MGSKNVTTIDVSKWAYGRTRGDRYLVNNGCDKKHCCLGFDGLASGVPLGDLSSEDDRWKEYEEFYHRWWSYQVMGKDGERRLVVEAVEINDRSSEGYTLYQRMKDLRGVFAKAGRKLRFVNVPKGGET